MVLNLVPNSISCNIPQYKQQTLHDGQAKQYLLNSLWKKSRKTRCAEYKNHLQRKPKTFRSKKTLLPEEELIQEIITNLLLSQKQLVTTKKTPAQLCDSGCNVIRYYESYKNHIKRGQIKNIGTSTLFYKSNDIYRCVFRFLSNIKIDCLAKIIINLIYSEVISILTNSS